MSECEHKHNIKKFQCKFKDCTKSFTRRCELKKHVKIHFNVRNYLCEVCSKTFVHKTSLRNHMNIHRAVKDSCCTFCGFQCAASNLKSHLKTHQKEDEKTFICKICDKKFHRKIALVDHEASHLNSKAYKCGTCPKYFASSSSLSKHKKIHIGLKKFMCPEPGCNLKFYQKVHLEKHSKRNHKQNEQTHVSGNKVKIISDEVIECSHI